MHDIAVLASHLNTRKAVIYNTAFAAVFRVGLYSSAIVVYDLRVSRNGPGGAGLRTLDRRIPIVTPATFAAQRHPRGPRAVSSVVKPIIPGKQIQGRATHRMAPRVLR